MELTGKLISSQTLLHQGPKPVVIVSWDFHGLMDEHTAQSIQIACALLLLNTMQAPKPVFQVSCGSICLWNKKVDLYAVLVFHLHAHTIYSLLCREDGFCCRTAICPWSMWWS